MSVAVTLLRDIERMNRRCEQLRYLHARGFVLPPVLLGALVLKSSGIALCKYDHKSVASLLAAQDSSLRDCESSSRRWVVCRALVADEPLRRPIWRN